jgi:DNA-binding NtrC family response regulator
MSRPRHALVAEDLDFWQDAVAEVLVDAGYRVSLAASYEQALDIFSREVVHLAVIDPVLDDTDRRNRDGLRILQYILDERPEVAAVVVTSSDPNRIGREVSALSADVPLLWKDEWDDEQFLEVVSRIGSRTIRRDT